jgi:adenine-specific DNA-methyltransferase
MMNDTTDQPEKFNLSSIDVGAEKRAELLRLFPEARTEGDKIDFERLKLALGGIVDAGRERYGLTWPGKADCFRTIQAPSLGTLRPVPSESINWDTTENLIIEGDNLEALKLLQKSYLGRIKMIYIDPPYNTGNDFIYPDNYGDSLQTYFEYTRQTDNEGRKYSSNMDTDGRFHSNWLNMMYPRLSLARSLLTDDGVIFVSIDDNEIENLRRICSEIFGEENFLVQIIWKKRSTPPNDQIIGANHDYILAFAKDADECRLNLRERSDLQSARYKNPDNHPKGPWAPGDLMANVKGGRFVKSLNFAIRNPNTGENHFPGENGNWRFNKEKVDRLLENHEISFGEDGKGRPKLKRFLADVKEGVTWPTIWDFAPLNTSGSEEMAEIFGDALVFESPKP